MKHRKTLVLNSATVEAPPAALEHFRFTANFAPSLIRNDTMEGRPFVVVPCVMIVEGVLSANNGPLFYPAAELAKTPEMWNAKPVVVYHPEVNGKGVSACDPHLFSTVKIGVLMNTRYDPAYKVNGKTRPALRSECWVEMSRAEEVDKRVAVAIANQQMLELSTGVWVDTELEAGEYNGTSYVGIARNLRADHLAVLPDMVGACSTMDGAGFIRNELGRFPLNSADKEQLYQVAVANLRAVGLLTENEISHDATRDLLRQALLARFPVKGGKGGDPSNGPWVDAVFSNFVIYERDGKLWKISYTKSDVLVQLSGDPVQVVRVTEYRTPDGSLVGDQTSPITTNKNKTTDMDKKQIVDGLIQNQESGFSEKDRDWLMGLEEAGLTVLSANAKALQEAKAKLAQNTGTAAPAPKPVAAPKTPEEFIATAPAEMQDSMRDMLATHAAQKAQLITTITTNAKGVYTDAELGDRSMAELRKIATLASRPVAPASPPRYDGMGAVATPVTNAAGEDEPLVSPSMDFSKK